MDWFERLTGFRETTYAETKARLAVEGRELVSRVNGRRFQIGDLELVSLADLRRRSAEADATPGRLRVHNISGDARALHSERTYAGALFQVASQFNLLEMVGSDVTPEHGVTGYQFDRTQGPACAIACGAATIYRNYFAPVGDQIGQTRDAQLDGLAEVGAYLAERLATQSTSLWTMRNGYALPSAESLRAINDLIANAPEVAEDIRQRLKIGLHWDVDVTDLSDDRRVSQAFCSALPVSYSGVPRVHWSPFAELILEAAYEATLWAAVLNARRSGTSKVLLTRLGGGAFGNADAWIDDALSRALTQFRDVDLEVFLVSYGPPPASMLRIAEPYR